MTKLTRKVSVYLDNIGYSTLLQLKSRLNMSMSAILKKIIYTSLEYAYFTCKREDPKEKYAEAMVMNFLKTFNVDEFDRAVIRKIGEEEWERKFKELNMKH